MLQSVSCQQIEAYRSSQGCCHKSIVPYSATQNLQTGHKKERAIGHEVRQRWAFPSHMQPQSSETEMVPKPVLQGDWGFFKPFLDNRGSTHTRPCLYNLNPVWGCACSNSRGTRVAAGRKCKVCHPFKYGVRGIHASCHETPFAHQRVNEPHQSPCCLRLPNCAAKTLQAPIHGEDSLLTFLPMFSRNGQKAM
jgi:hypothetical protein